MYCFFLRGSGSSSEGCWMRENGNFYKFGKYVHVEKIGVVKSGDIISIKVSLRLVFCLCVFIVLHGVYRWMRRRQVGRLPLLVVGVVKRMFRGLFPLLKECGFQW